MNNSTSSPPIMAKLYPPVVPGRLQASVASQIAAARRQVNRPTPKESASTATSMPASDEIRLRVDINDLLPLVQSMINRLAQYNRAIKQVGNLSAQCDKSGAFVEEWEQGERREMQNASKFLNRLGDVTDIDRPLLNRANALIHAIKLGNYDVIRSIAFALTALFRALLPTITALRSKLGYARTLGAICEDWAEIAVDNVQSALDDARERLFQATEPLMAMCKILRMTEKTAEGIVELDWNGVLWQNVETTEEALDEWWAPRPARNRDKFQNSLKKQELAESQSGRDSVEKPE